MAAHFLLFLYKSSYLPPKSGASFYNDWQICLAPYLVTNRAACTT